MYFMILTRSNSPFFVSTKQIKMAFNSSLLRYEHVIAKSLLKSILILGGKKFTVVLHTL